MDLNLKGRVAVITGGAAGIGEAIARALAAEGCVTCILDKNADAARKAASAIAADGAKARSAAADVGDPAAVSRAFEEFVAAEKRLDILVNAAGLFRPAQSPISTLGNGTGSAVSISRACSIA